MMVLMGLDGGGRVRDVAVGIAMQRLDLEG